MGTPEFQYSCNALTTISVKPSILRSSRLLMCMGSHMGSHPGKGGEKVLMFMLTHPLRSPGRGSMIVRLSDQRVDRMWKDVHQGVPRL